ncbi:hypothetical protein ACET3Z_012424 [Daucus carota]
MAQTMLRLCVCVLLFLSVVVADGTPKAKKVRCKDKNFPSCYKTQLLCPDSCLRTCELDCASCQPVCNTSLPSSPPPPPPPKPQKAMKVRCKDKAYRPGCYNQQFYCPSSCPRSCEVDCGSCQPVCKIAPPVATPPPPPAAVTPPPPPETETSPAKAYCKNKHYPQCYRQEQNCPSACPDQCEIDCVTCSPVCDCNKPGAVCQDPRFVGGDGITFYFHGKKDQEFCLLSDSNLHINAHFIGKRNDNMQRDFTWVQSLGIIFDNHQLYIGAMKTAIWDSAVDRVELSLDGEPIFLPEGEGAQWKPKSAPEVSITRSRDTNAIVIEVEGNFKIKANVVPITSRDSLVHNYAITSDDCFAHLDLGFTFYSLSNDVSGVLGQTYAGNYTSRVKMGVTMPVLGGDKDFASSSLFSADCAVARFNGLLDSSTNIASSGINGRGIIFRK